MSDDFTDSLASITAILEKKANVEKAVALIDECRFRAIGERSPAKAFFSSLALGLDPVPNHDIDTMATDGKRMLFNPEFTIGLDKEERYGIAMAHEPLHCGQQHFTRGQHFDDLALANVAGDLEINQIVLEAGYKLPKTACLPGRGEFKDIPPNLVFEEYYTLLKDKKSKQGGDQPGDSDGQSNDPGGCGGFIRPKDQAAAEAAAAHWAGQVAAAADAAKRRGELPSSLERLIGRILKPKVDPWTLLRDYLTRIAKTEQSWARVNRRALANGFYMPSKHSQALGDVCLLVDTSGSIGDEQLALMAGFMEGVLSANPGTLTIVYHTTDVYDIETWVPEQGPLELTNKKSGGTSHVEAFKTALSLDTVPAVIIALTDLESDLEQIEDPGIPTIFVDVAGGHEQPFGQYVSIA